MQKLIGGWGLLCGNLRRNIHLLSNFQFGRLAEMQAANFLLFKGFRIIQRNYRCTYAEIDLIVCKDSVLSFVEVKAGRSKIDFLDYKVNFVKQQKIIKAANDFLLTKKIEEQHLRFDVLIVRYTKKWHFSYYQDAF